jgi:2,4-didehydro-3-deoxy-L-rhamnonate hydrolase
MKFANLKGRTKLVRADGAVDIDQASNGALPADPDEALERWDEVLAWAQTYTGQATEAVPTLQELSAPSPRPRQAFGIGLNYAPHAAESGFEVPKHPFVFAKMASSLAGPYGDLIIRDSESIDWEVEAVVIIGRTARDVDAGAAWDYVAGVTCGQDFSDRAIQWRLGPNRQTTLGKSLPGFGRTGPLLVTPDEYENPDDIELSCTVNGEERQHGRTSELIFNVPTLIEYLTAVTTLFPGDLIFTGTPEGVGIGRTPPLYLKPGDVVESFVAKAGSMKHVVK